MELPARFTGRPGWRRRILLRRVLAGVIAALALVLAVVPERATVPVVVAASDLASGSTLAAAGLAVRAYPPELVPAGALDDPAGASGRVLVGPARAGEPLTDARLTGAGPLPGGAAAVPVRLADPDVAALLRPGSRVDVVTPGERADEPVVLAPDAEVLAVVDAGGPLLLVAVQRSVATRIAAVGLAGQVAVTLR